MVDRCERGIDLSGVENFPLAVALWCVGTALIAAALVLWIRERRKRRDSEQDTLEETELSDVQVKAGFSPRQQARALHAEILRLERELWQVRAQVPKGRNLLQDENVLKVFDDIKSLRNVPENSRIANPGLEAKFDALVSLYMHALEFHMDRHSAAVVEGLHSAHSAVRHYIEHHVKE